MNRFFIQPDKTTTDYVIPGVAGWLVEGVLAEKIMSLYPFFDFVVENDELVDVTDDLGARAAWEAQAKQPPLGVDDLALALAEIYEMVVANNG